MLILDIWLDKFSLFSHNRCSIQRIGRSDLWALLKGWPNRGPLLSFHRQIAISAMSKFGMDLIEELCQEDPNLRIALPSFVLRAGFAHGPDEPFASDEDYMKFVCAISVLKDKVRRSVEHMADLITRPMEGVRFPLHSFPFLVFISNRISPFSLHCWVSC